VDPVTMSVVAGLVMMGGSALGDWLAGSQDEEERRQRQAALEEYASIAPLEHKQLVARELQRTRMEDVRRNPALDADMDEVQGRLMEVGRGGESAAARADYELASQESSMMERAARAAALSQADAAGLGPEAAYSDMLLASQAGADRERMAGLQRAGMGERNRMTALGQAGGMAERRSATQWSQDAEVAQAQDDFERFNVGEFNDMQRYNRDDELGVWDRNLSLADRRAGQRNELGDMHERRGQRTRQRVGDISTGAGRAIMAPSIYGPSGTGGGGTPPAAAPAAAAAPLPPSGPAPAVQPAQPQQRALPYDDPRRRRLR
jgi:hypothetical protein